MESKRIEIDLGNGCKLTAEVGSDPMYPREIYVGIEKDGIWYQDLAIIKNTEKLLNGELTYIPNLFSVLVFADENLEDYTDRFEIKTHEEEEEKE